MAQQSGRIEADVETKSGKSTAEGKKSQSAKRTDQKQARPAKSKGKPADAHEEHKMVRQSPVRHTEGLKRSKKVIGKQLKKKATQSQLTEAKSAKS